jgi:DNA-binding protein HU-beta
MLEAIATALANEETVTFVGFGSFSVTTRAARTGRNPQTGKEIQIAEKKVVKFNVGKNLKESLCEIKTKTGCGCKTGKAKKK